MVEITLKQKDSKVKKGYYVELPEPVIEMTGSELKEYFPPGTYKKLNNKQELIDCPFYTKAYLMRSIIMNEIQFNKYPEQRTLRGFWYSTVKPTLSKLGLLTADDNTEAGLSRWDATLSRYVANLLRNNKLTYSDLGILDTSRRREIPYIGYYTGGENKGFSYQASVAPYPNIIIATEKDTVFRIISNLSSLLGISCISSKGQNSLGAMEDLIRGIMDKKDELKLDFEEIIIMTLTDYDPAGYYIANALETQATDILAALGYWNISVSIKRIGITPSQLTEDEVEMNKYTPKPANLKKWVDATGGINGEPFGLELDALKTSQIREIFVDAIKPFIEVHHYTSFVKKSYLKEVVLTALENNVIRICDALEEKYLDKLTVKDFDIFERALKGRISISPASLCHSTFDDEIEEETLKYFNI